MELIKFPFALLNSFKVSQKIAGVYLQDSGSGLPVTSKGTALRKNQSWTFEIASDYAPTSQGGVFGYLKNNATGKYLAVLVNQQGCVAKLSDKPTARNGALPYELFEVRSYPDGRWALVTRRGQSLADVKKEYYFGDEGAEIVHAEVPAPADWLNAPMPSPAQLWNVQLDMHPQINIRSLSDKGYIHVNKFDTMDTKEIIPWGADAMITLTFFPECGLYGLQAFNGLFLTETGVLKFHFPLTPDLLFALEIRPGSIFAFRNVASGLYLSSAKGDIIKARGKTVAGDTELFTFEDSRPQIKIKTSEGLLRVVTSGTGFISKKDLSPAEDDAHRFQIEARSDVGSNQWSIRTAKNTFWALDASGTIRSDGATNKDFFTIEWLGACIAIKAANGKYVSVDGKGLMATGFKPCLFIWELINRPLLVMRTAAGYVSCNFSPDGPGSVFKCNFPNPRVFFCQIKAGLVGLRTVQVPVYKSTVGNMLEPRPHWLHLGKSPVIDLVYHNDKEYNLPAHARFEMQIVDDTHMVLRYQEKYFQAQKN